MTSKKSWPLARRTLADYTDNSSVHGVRYIGEKELSLGERILWAVMFLIMMIGCKILIFDAYIKWKENPVIVSFANRPTSIWHIPFPAVTICPETKVAAEKLNITEMYHNFSNHKDLLYDLPEDEISSITALAQVCDSSVFARIDPEKMTDCSKCVDTLRSIAIHKSNIIALCYFENLRYERDDLFDEVVTEEGICYTFNGIKVHRHEDGASGNWTLDEGYTTTYIDTYPKRAMNVGPDYSLYMFLGLCDYDFDFICRKSTQGFKLLLHIPTEVPQISKHFYRIPFKQDVRVAIKPHMMTTADSLRPYQPNTRQCYFQGERYLRWFKEYTQRNCELECLANQTQRKCGCTLFNMPTPSAADGKVCGAGEILCISNVRMQVTDTFCNCLPSCSMITYDAEISQAESSMEKFYQARNFKGLAAKDLYVLKHCPLTQVSIHFKEEQFISLIRSEYYGNANFLSNCGGLLGLFLGISWMSIVEIVYFCSIRLLCSYQLQYRRQKRRLSQIVWVKPRSQ